MFRWKFDLRLPFPLIHDSALNSAETMTRKLQTSNIQLYYFSNDQLVPTKIILMYVARIIQYFIKRPCNHVKNSQLICLTVCHQTMADRRGAARTDKNKNELAKSDDNYFSSLRNVISECFQRLSICVICVLRNQNVAKYVCSKFDCMNNFPVRRHSAIVFFFSLCTKYCS